MFERIKKLFTNEKSEEALQMWETLSEYDDYDGDPEFHPSLNINAQYALSLSDEGRQRYLLDLVKRRNEAHNTYLDKKYREL